MASGEIEERPLRETDTCDSGDGQNAEGMAGDGVSDSLTLVDRLIVIPTGQPDGETYCSERQQQLTDSNGDILITDEERVVNITAAIIAQPSDSSSFFN